jgi:hypothetical protein
MAYAAKHGYPAIVDKTAPLVVGLPIANVVGLLPQRLVVPWVGTMRSLKIISPDSLNSFRLFIDNNGTTFYYSPLPPNLLLATNTTTVILDALASSIVTIVGHTLQDSAECLISSSASLLCLLWTL